MSIVQNSAVTSHKQSFTNHKIDNVENQLNTCSKLLHLHSLSVSVYNTLSFALHCQLNILQGHANVSTCCIVPNVSVKPFLKVPPSTINDIGFHSPIDMKNYI